MYTEKIGTEYNNSLNRIAATNNLKEAVLDATVQAFKNDKERLAQIMELTSNTTNAVKQQAADQKAGLTHLKEIQAKMEKMTEKLGLRLKLDVSKGGDALVRIYNEINDQQMATIPLHILFSKVQGAQSVGNTAVDGNNGILI